MPEGERKELIRLARLAGQAMFIPIFLALFPLAFYWFGAKLDAWWGTTPWMARGFLGLGLVSAFRQVKKVIRQIIADSSPPPPPKDE